MSRRIRLGESLLEAGLINQAQLEEALARQATTGERIGEALVALGLITEGDLLRTLAKDAEIAFLDASELRVDPGVLSLIPAETARSNKLIPLRADGRALVVAMSNPFDIGAIRALETATGRQVRTVTADPAAIARLVEVHYEGAGRASAGLRRPSWTGRIEQPANVNVESPPVVEQPSRPAGNIELRFVVGGGERHLLRSPRGERTFAVLLGSSAVLVVEYRQDPAGFALLATRERRQRFADAGAATDAAIALLAELNAKSASVSVIVQQFGSFFHTVTVPHSELANAQAFLRQEIQRAFSPGDAVVVCAADAPDGTGEHQRATLAGAPTSTIDAITARFASTRFRLACLTVAPEAFGHLYMALDGSMETTALVVCLDNRPYTAFFVDGRLALALEPPARAGDAASLDVAQVVDQVERGAMFLRQQASGAVATRLLLVAPQSEREALVSAIETRTGLDVGEIGKDIGSPEALAAIGAVLSSQSAKGLNLVHAVAASRTAGPTISSTILATLQVAAAVSAIWAATRVVSLRQESRELAQAQARVEKALPTIAAMRNQAEIRRRVASIRSAHRDVAAERAALQSLLAGVAEALPAGAELDTLDVVRVKGGWETAISGRVNGTGVLPMSTAISYSRQLRSRSQLEGARLETASNSSLAGRSGERPSLLFTIRGVAAIGDR